MNKIIQNLKSKIKNGKKEPNFAWIPSLSSMIVFSILGVISSNYLAEPNQTASIEVYPVPKTGKTLVYRDASFTQCVQAASGGCLSLPDDVKLYVQPQLEKIGAMITDCSNSELCEMVKGSFIRSHHFVSSEPGFIDPQLLDDNKKAGWITQKIKLWKVLYDPSLYSESSKVLKIINELTPQTTEGIAKLLPPGIPLSALDESYDLQEFKELAKNKEVLNFLKNTPEGTVKELKSLPYEQWPQEFQKAYRIKYGGYILIANSFERFFAIGW